MRLGIAIALVIVILAPYTYGANSRDSILGVWSMRDHETQFEIYKCGAEFCGRISYMREPNYPATDKHGLAGLPKMDLENPDPLMRNRPLLGLPLLEGFHYSGDNTWDGGRIYNPEDGKKYRCKLWLDGENRLKLRGYLGIPVLGRTETWIR